MPVVQANAAGDLKRCLHRLPGRPGDSFAKRVSSNLAICGVRNALCIGESCSACQYIRWFGCKYRQGLGDSGFRAPCLDAQCVFGTHRPWMRSPHVCKLLGQGCSPVVAVALVESFGFDSVSCNACVASRVVGLCLFSSSHTHSAVCQHADAHIRRHCKASASAGGGLQLHSRPGSGAVWRGPESTSGYLGRFAEAQKPVPKTPTELLPRRPCRAGNDRKPNPKDAPRRVELRERVERFGWKGRPLSRGRSV